MYLEKGVANIEKASDVLFDQIRAIDNKRLIKKLGMLPRESIESVRERLKIVLDLE